jgi:MFS family permease
VPTYFSEFTLNWRALIGASIGLAMGAAISHYTMSLFGPPLLTEFGWSKAQFALIGSMPLVTLVFVPFAGRFTDRYGTRVAAAVGFSALPLGFIAFALMSGSIVEFFAIWVAQNIFGVLTTSLVFCRVVVERFDVARGIALSVMMSAPPLVGAIAAPLLGSVIETEGWRAGYFALAASTAVGGLMAIAMMGRNKRKSVPRPVSVHLSRTELAALVKHPVLILAVLGMFLVNIPQVFASSQLKLIAMDSGVTSETATWLMSMYAIGVVVGRLLSGLALDRVEPHFVALATLGLPTIGYLIFAAGIVEVGLLSGAVLMVGLAQGAESDVGAYLISRRFDMKNFSLLLSFLTAMVGLGSVAGSLILSTTLRFNDSYKPFLLAAAVGTLLGAICFGLTGTRHARTGSSHATLQIASQVDVKEH